MPPTPTTSDTQCGAVPTFDDGLQPAIELHVATTGDDAASGDRAAPLRTVREAARRAVPGSAIRIHPGRYAGAYIQDLAGEEGAPIWIGGASITEPPVFSGGTEGLHLTRVRWLVVHDLVVENASGNGINTDDGGAVAESGVTAHIVFRRINVRQIGGTGNQDCLKLSGVYDFVVVDSTFAACGGGQSGSGIDMVGCHRGVIARNSFADMSGNAIQAKGGTADIDIRWNHVVNGGGRGVNMGGSTGLMYFRPPVDPAAPNAEARRIRVTANLFDGADTPVAFVGCVDCEVVNNTIRHPAIWLFRILQETRSSPEYEFEPARRGRFVNNIVIYRRDQVRATVNVGPGTAAETFDFRNNLWFAADAPERSAPELPAAEVGAVTGRDPLVASNGSISATSPAAGAGMVWPNIDGDMAGRCYGSPPSIGAFEAPESAASSRGTR